VHSGGPVSYDAARAFHSHTIEADAALALLTSHMVEAPRRALHEEDSASWKAAPSSLRGGFGELRCSAFKRHTVEAGATLRRGLGELGHLSVNVYVGDSEGCVAAHSTVTR